MSDQDTFKSVSVAALRYMHAMIAKNALEDDDLLPVFAEVDAQLAEYEATRPKDSAIERARAKLRMKRSA